MIVTMTINSSLPCIKLRQYRLRSLRIRNCMNEKCMVLICCFSIADLRHRKRRRVVSEPRDIENKLESLILRVGEKVC